MNFSVTEYFKHVRLRPDRIIIKDAWIEQALRNPIHEEVQADGRFRRWAKIAEANDRYLRIIVLEDGETVHNDFLDRRFKES